MTRSIKDFNLANHLLSVLLDRNEVQVFDLRTRQRLFKSSYRDASGQITRLFYLDPEQSFESEVESDVEEEEQEPEEEADDNRFIDDEVVGDDD